MVKALFDHNMPPAIARSLHEIVRLDGHEANAVRDLFPVNISDKDLFKNLGPEWVLISKDRSQAKRKPERLGIIKSNIVAFYLSKSVEQQRINEQAATILWQWDKMVLQRKNNRNGLFLLPVNKGTQFSTLPG